MTTFSVCFTNFGPYHLARLRALSSRLERSGDRLLAIEVADQERRYPWSRGSDAEPFAWTTLFPGRDLETITREECVRAMNRLLDEERPDALGIVGYSRPESMAAPGGPVGRGGRPSDGWRSSGDRPPANWGRKR